jgi:hypothetical protein
MCPNGILKKKILALLKIILVNKCLKNKSSLYLINKKVIE